MAEVTMVHTRRGMFLTKQRYTSWREVQAEHTDYMASLGPYSATELMEYLDLEYPTSKPFERLEVEAFMANSSQVDLWAE